MHTIHFVILFEIMFYEPILFNQNGDIFLTINLKGYSTFFWKWAHFTTPSELNS